MVLHHATRYDHTTWQLVPFCTPEDLEYAQAQGRWVQRSTVQRRTAQRNLVATSDGGWGHLKRSSALVEVWGPTVEPHSVHGRPRPRAATAAATMTRTAETVTRQRPIILNTSDGHAPTSATPQIPMRILPRFIALLLHPLQTFL